MSTSAVVHNPVRPDAARILPPGVGAVVIGGEHPGLAVARSLGSRGIPVYVIDDQFSVSSFSRYVTRCIRVNDLRNERNTIQALLDIGRQFHLKDWVLFPTRDETVAACARFRDELASFYRVTTPAWNTVRWAWNKRNTYKLAEQLAIPCPQTWCPRSADELPPLYPKLPLAIKPAIKENFFYATGAKAWRADTPDELHRLFAKAQHEVGAEEILVQEIIPGEGSQQFSYCAYFRDGEAYGTLLARRQRQHPREFGRAATYVESADVPIIEELSKRFLTAIDYNGLVEIEYKQDPRDGLYKILDVNARVWGFHALGHAAGVDFSYLQFADRLGIPISPCRGRAGIGWLRLMTDLPTALGALLKGRLDISSYFRSLRNTHIESVYSSRDPLPSLGELFLLPYMVVKKLIWPGFFTAGSSLKE